MRADDLDLLPGYSRRKLRDFCRGCGPLTTFVDAYVADYFGQDITDDLLRAGVIEPARESSYNSQTDELSYEGPIIAGRYRLTKLGCRIAHVRLQNPIPRAKAEQIVAAMLERARAINRDQDLLYRITTITAIGSYLTDAPDLGDIDVGVETRRKIKSYEQHKAAAIARARAKAPYRDFYGADDEDDYVQREVLLRLKNRNRYISLIRDYDNLDTPKRVIFSEAAEG